MLKPATVRAPGHGVRALVIGYGSIGRRHGAVLAELGCEVAVLSRRAVDAPLAYTTLDQALALHRPGYIVVANETAAHGTMVDALAATGYDGIVLVEKPLFAAVAALPAHRFRAAYVAYNLRFHPIIARLRTLLADQSLVSFNAYVGHYLPEWRPATDYRQCYSARADSGGGVLRDLSHELDYLHWIAGSWRSVSALGGQFSALDIDSEDVFSLLMTTVRCPVVSVHLNYLDRRARRHLVINTASDTFEADLIAGTLRHGGGEEHFVTERNTTYLRMHQAILGGDADDACSLPEGLETLGLIEGAQQSAQTQQWVFQ